jgi:hypothetical protein
VELIPGHILDQFELFRRGEYLTGPEAQQIDLLIDQARTNGSQIREPLLFMLALLLVNAKHDAGDLKAQNEFSLAARAEFTAQAMGYSSPEHDFSGMPPVRAISLGVKALADLHRSAKGLKTAIDTYARAFERHYPKLPDWHRRSLTKDIIDLRRLAERQRYFTRNELLASEPLKAPRTRPQHQALIWWCYYYPDKENGFEDLYERAVLWGLSDANSKESFARNLRRIKTAVSKRKCVSSPSWWFHPSDQPVHPIRIPSSRDS